MATLTTSYGVPASEQRASMLRRMLAGAAAFDAVGGVFCLAAASDLAGWLSIPRDAAYVTGALFLGAAVVGGLTLRRKPLEVTWVVGANEVFALWCVVMLAVGRPSALGVVLLVVATLSSAGTGVAEYLLAGRRQRGASSPEM